jgi:hypothetical protein
MRLNLVIFIPLLSIAAPQVFPHEEVGVDKASFTTTHAPAHAHRMRQLAIAEMDIDQDQDGDGDWDAHTDPITKTIADPLSSKLCSDDVCFVKTHLPSKFFSVRNPKNLTLSGVVVMQLCDANLGSATTTSAPSAPPSGFRYRSPTFPRRSLHDLHNIISSRLLYSVQTVSSRYTYVI